MSCLGEIEELESSPPEPPVNGTTSETTSAAFRTTPTGVAAGRYYGTAHVECDVAEAESPARDGVVCDLLLETLRTPLSAEGLTATVVAMQVEFLQPVPSGVRLDYVAWQTQRLGLRVTSATTLYGGDSVYAQGTAEFLIDQAI
ncbi:hypothetical protein ACWDTD_04235 [Gordonia sp. NPDC003425]